MKKNSFLYGTFILIIVNFIVRFFGFAYKIILSRMLGAEAIGLFHLVFPILMTLITFTTAGIPIAVSKLVAHYMSLQDKRGCNKVLGLSLFIGIFISCFMSLILFYNAKFISTHMLKNNDVLLSLIALTPAIPLITLSSIFRGYYYGMQEMGPPGIAQILEQIFRIVFVISLIIILPPMSPSHAAVVAVIGISVGELIGLLWLLFKYKFLEAFRLRKTYHILRDRSFHIVGKIFFISAPITLSRLIGVLMQSVNSAIIPQRLQEAGYTSQQAVSVFGKLTGMAMPLLFLPFIVTSALVVNIIPSISEEVAQKNFREVSLKSSIAIRMTLLVAIPLTALFICFAEPICKLIYNQEDVSKYLVLLAYSTIFLSLYHTASGILHGMGKQVATTVNYLLGMLIQLGCTYYLVSNPKFVENGFIIGFILSTLCICILNLIVLRFYVKLNLNLLNSVFKPLFASMIMILCMVNIYNLTAHIYPSLGLQLFFSLLLGIMVYLLTVVITGSISLRTIRYIIKKR